MDSWCAREGLTRGHVLSLEQGWTLARAWYSDRLSPDWRRNTPDETRALFSELGLTDPFWQL
jgi:hypothetical protein